MNPNLQTGSSDGPQTVQPPDAEVEGVVQSLTKSAALIRALRTEPKYKAELADELGVSKSTVYNWLTELKEYGFVERSADGFRLTSTGRLQANLYREFHETSRQVQDATDILQEIPPAHVPPTDVLTDGQLTVRRTNQYELVTELVAIAREATQITGLFPMLCEPIIAAVAEKLENDDLQLEFILSSHAHQTLLDYHQSHGQVLTAAESATVLTYRDRLPLGLAVIDGRVYILGYHDEMVFLGYVMTESPAAIDWAHDHIDAFRSQSTPVAADDTNSTPGNCFNTPTAE